MVLELEINERTAIEHTKRQYINHQQYDSSIAHRHKTRTEQMNVQSLLLDEIIDEYDRHRNEGHQEYIGVDKRTPRFRK